MPLYQFRCTKCGKEYEYFAGYEWRHATWYCQDCHAKLRRIISTPHLHGSENMPND